MIEPPVPKDEEKRLNALHELNILDTPAEDRFDRITRLATRILDVPIALITLINGNRQWIKGCCGLDATETPRAVSFCAHAINSDETLVVPNALEDPRFLDNPLVVGEPFIRFYAGHPITSPDGYKIGTLCVIDRKPRSFGPAELTSLRDLASWVENELKVVGLSYAQIELISELDVVRRQSMLDSLTRTWNRSAIVDILQREIAHAERNSSSVGVIMADIDHFKKINDTHGHLTGDAVIKEVVTRIRGAIRQYDAIGRFGGEEFLIVVPNIQMPQLLRVAEHIRRRVQEGPVEFGDLQLPITASFGVTCSLPMTQHKVDDLIQSADSALYKAKNAGRNSVEQAP